MSVYFLHSRENVQPLWRGIFIAHPLSSIM